MYLDKAQLLTYLRSSGKKVGLFIIIIIITWHRKAIR